MKTILFLLALTSLLVSQEYQKAKIDMHGGNFNSYNSSSYEKAGLRSMGSSLSGFLDTNATKNIQKKTK